MTKEEILQDLEAHGSDSTKKTLIKHGAREPFYGVKVEHLKKLMKVLKKDYALSMQLWDTGISDAMYLAGLISDPAKMSKADLHHWAKTAYWYMLTEYPVAWAASEHKDGWELAQEWIKDKNEHIQCAGWCTLSALVSIKPDSEIDEKLVRKLLASIPKDIKTALNRTKYCMNGFVIAAGAYLSGITEEAKKVAVQIGKVSVDMGGTACKVPDALPYIEKIESMGKIGQKRKTVRC